MQPPTAEEENQDFKRACDEVQQWFDSPRFKGIKVSLPYAMSSSDCLMKAHIRLSLVCSDPMDLQTSSQNEDQCQYSHLNHH